jgi:hypothetical protein
MFHSANFVDMHSISFAHGNIFTRHETLVFEMKSWLIFLITSDVVVEGPRSPTPVAKMADFVRDSGAKFDHAKLLAMLFPEVSIYFAFSIEGKLEGR